MIAKVRDHVDPLEIEKTVRDLYKEDASDEDEIDISDVPLSLNKNVLIQERGEQDEWVSRIGELFVEEGSVRGREVSAEGNIRGSVCSGKKKKTNKMVFFGNSTLCSPIVCKLFMSVE